jgi:NADH:ubiquinone oxidoreductase subunit E/ferredoxin
MVIIIAIGVTVGLFVGLTLFLLIAERFLVNYGPCAINVNQGEKIVQVQGGATLLNLLKENGYSIPSACGGKGSCGYCRVVVLRGGGPILPTESPLLTRTEMRAGVRLSCQVKVKSDIDVRIPDFLETVRNMVDSKMFDPKLRWRWLAARAPDVEPPALPPNTHATHEQATIVRQILARHEGRQGSIVPILQEVNTAFNYLPEGVIRLLAEELHRPISDIHRVGTFYNSFSLKPRGKNVIKVCMGTACYVKRGEKILESVERKLGIKCEECTPDGKFSIETVSCIGCCGQSPSMMIGNEIYGYLRPEMIDGIIEKLS